MIGGGAPVVARAGGDLAARARRVLAVACFVVLAMSACGGGGGAAPAAPPEPPVDARDEVEPNDEPALALDVGRLDREVSVQGTLSHVGSDGLFATGDRDVVRFTAPDHGRLVVRCELEGGLDGDLVLRDETERMLATARSDNLVVGPIERLHHAVAKDAVYLLEVVGFAGSAGTYVVRLAVDGRGGGAVAPERTTTTRLPMLASARSFHGLAVLPDGGALVAGGTTDPSSSSAAILSALSSSERFESGVDVFATGPTLANGRFACTATALSSGRVLVAGGDLGATSDVYDPWSRTFVASGVALPQGMRVMHTATLLADGRVLLAGGTRVRFTPTPVAENLATTTIFDPKSRSFTAGPTLARTRTSHAAVRLLDGRVLVLGGVGRADTELLDVRRPEPTAWTVGAGPALVGVRDDHTATLLADGRVLVTGGQDGSGRSLDDAQILDDFAAAPASAFRALGARMGSRRADHVAVPLPSGQVLLLGGEDDPGDGSGDAILSSVDLYEPATETFTPMPPLDVGRDDHRAVRLLDGRILVTGGEDETSTSIRAAEAYVPR